MRTPYTFTSLAALALLAGCTPMDGDVTGTYLAYFAEASSQNILNLEGRGIDFTDPEVLERNNLVPVDCRLLDADDEGQRLAGADYEADCLDEDGEHNTPNWFYWLDQYAYLLREEQNIEPWRVEAVMTSEHALQLTVHVDAGRFGDFRYGFVVDPYFQPETCVDSADGAVIEPVDGDWVANWSSASREGNGTFYHLNAYAYQINPATGDAYWSFDYRWYAGYGFGRIGDEELYGHQLDYIDQYGAPLYYLAESTAATTVLPPRRYDTYGEWADAFADRFAGDALDGSGSFNDLMEIGKAETPFDVRIEDNDWRIDTSDPEEVKNEASNNYAYGLENWVGVSPAWVRFDMEPEEFRGITAGVRDAPLTGQYALFIEPVSSATKVFVTGTFSIDRIRDDVWGYDPTLQEIKEDENNTPECGEDRLTVDYDEGT